MDYAEQFIPTCATGEYQNGKAATQQHLRPLLHISVQTVPTRYGASQI